MEKLEAIRELRDQARGLEFGERDTLDAFERKGKMVLRNLFGEDSRWLAEFDAIWLVASGLRTIEGEMDDWNRGRSQYVNLLTTLEEQLTTFGDCEIQSTAPTDPLRESSDEIVELRPNFFGLGINLRALWRNLQGQFPWVTKKEHDQ